MPSVLRNIGGGGVAKKMIDQPGGLHQGLIMHAFLDEIEARRTALPDVQPTPPNGIFSPYLLRNCRTLPADASDALSGTHPIECVIEHADSRSSTRSAHATSWAATARRAMCAGVLRAVRSATAIFYHDRPTRGKPRTILRAAANKVVSIASDKATQDICIARAKKIFELFELEFGHVDWFSVYQIGQRITSQYTLDHRNFLGGDATHTHSPQAGQGMNISMLDIYPLFANPNPRLNLVMKGHGKPEILLPSYEHEWRVAEELLKFDGTYSGQLPTFLPASGPSSAQAR
ncbi:FAD binding domain-containing protein [Mycena latifolia]|nr:FAD binding domain-containing protein [Mycena latifolia]